MKGPGKYGAECEAMLRDTGAVTRCCLRRANHGCPDPLPEAQAAAKRRVRG